MLSGDYDSCIVSEQRQAVKPAAVFLYPTFLFLNAFPGERMSLIASAAAAFSDWIACKYMLLVVVGLA